MNKVEMIEAIKKLKIEKNAVILAHYYQNADVQDVADYVGDSLALSQIAATTTSDIIVFCGVHFMAETAKILSPEKMVLLPVLEAGCPMANMIDEKSLLEYKKNNPETVIICYVNSTAKVKALSDVCVTSSNAEKIVKHFYQLGKKILYCPDQNLGKYLMDKEKLSFDVWHGFCCIHHRLTSNLVIDMRKKYPQAQFICHPEAKLEVLKLADFVGSTKQLIEYATKSTHQEFIIGTEEGILHPLRIGNPNKTFHILTDELRCFDMKLTELNDVYHALNTLKNVIEVEQNVLEKAKKSLDLMLELSK